MAREESEKAWKAFGQIGRHITIDKIIPENSPQST
jgi:hypothetical protein